MLLHLVVRFLSAVLTQNKTEHSLKLTPARVAGVKPSSYAYFLPVLEDDPIPTASLLLPSPRRSYLIRPLTLVPSLVEIRPEDSDRSDGDDADDENAGFGAKPAEPTNSADATRTTHAL